MGRVHATYGHPLRKHVGHFASPNGPRPLTGKRDTELKMLLQPVYAQEFEGWPTDGFDNRSGHF